MQIALDRLSLGKVSWEQFLLECPISSHPALHMSTTQGSQSLLHLAVLSNRAYLVEAIASKEPHLKLRRNAAGWTPLELARFLPREHIASILHHPVSFSFYEQAQVFISDPEKFQIRNQDLIYLPHIRYESEAIFDEVLHRAKHAKAEDSVPLERIWMGIYFDDEIQKGIHPRVSIRFMGNEIGFGVFAEQKISSCAFIGEYTGLLQEKRKLSKESVYSIRYTIWEMGRKSLVINAEKMGNFTRFINHSAKPNIGLQSVYWRGMPRMIFVALKEISQGEQITFDYGIAFWKKCRKAPSLI